MNAKQIWQSTLERLQPKVSSAIYTTWFLGATAHSFQNGVFVVGVPSEFIRVQLEVRFIDTIRAILEEITGQNVDLHFVIAQEQAQEPEIVREEQPISYQLARRPLKLPRGRTSAGRRLARGNTFLSPRVPYPQPLPEEEESYEEAPLSPKELPVSPLPSKPRPQVVEKPRSASPFPQPEGTALNLRYKFHSFIVGKSNQLAHAASLAISENPGRIYNPLFLYGGVGLGKTHLMHAVGHVGLENGLNVLYTTSEKFTNEIINAIRYQRTEEFRAKYRQIDILLVDDIQFIAGKESTEEEFFHTFNTLHSENKQIIVTSDRPPKGIHNLQDRLRSRFEWGLLADIQPPEYEHRLAILRSKCDSLHFAIPHEVIEYIARPESSNVRELEGALNRVIAFATLHDRPLSPELAAEALENIFHAKKSAHNATLSAAEVLHGVCRYYNVPIELIRGKQRDRDIAWPRQVAMYLMRESTTASLQQIGAELGGRDHTTIMHGWEKVNGEMKYNDRVRHEVSAVAASLQER